MLSILCIIYNSTYIPVSINFRFFSSRNIIDVANNNELGACTLSPSFIKSTLYNNPVCETVTVFPRIVMLSPILNGLAFAKYTPDIIFPIRFYAAKPITIPVTVPIDAAMAGLRQT
jgi:hypothetical protein